MGCCYSRLEREEMVSRCKARKRYMKQLVRARQAMSASHAMYLRSLRSTGSSLLNFSNSETTLHHPHHFHTNNYHHRHPQTHVPPPPPPPPPLSPMSSSAATWTTTTTSSTALPPPPPPPQSSSWDFWDPFVPPPPPSEEEGEWGEEVATTTVVSDTAVTATEPPASVVSSGGSTELAMVVRNSNGKDLGEILKEVDEYFLRAADAGGQLSCLLEVNSHFNSNSMSFSGQTQIKAGKVYNEGCNLTSPSSWSWVGSTSPKLNGFGKLGDLRQEVGGTGISHFSTLERLYAWEKKLFQEVKNAESLKIEREKKVTYLRKLEVRRADYVKTEKTKKEVEKLESQMMVAAQAIDSASCEIIKLRETELYPQLLELLKGLMCMWRSMYEAHQVQTHIVQQLKYLNTIPSTEPTSEIHRQSTLQLELQVQQWHLSFCNLVKSQRDYIQSLTGWLRLSLFQFGKNPLSRISEESRIYSLCEEWHHAVDRIPDKVASEGIKSFLTVVHAIVVQQAEEQKQKKKSQSAFKEFEKKVAELRSLESKFGPYAMPETPGSTRSKDPVTEKRAKVGILKAKAEEEKTKHEKSVSITRAMTINNLQMGFPHVFQSMVGFSSVCMQAFESVYNQAKCTNEHDVKRLLP